MLVYDITCRDSFEKISFFLNDFKNNNAGPYVFVLLGNKMDCVDREVKYDEGEKMAASMGSIFLECSAYTGENIEEIFRVLIDQIQDGNITPRQDRQSISIIEKKTKKQVSKCC